MIWRRTSFFLLSNFDVPVNQKVNTSIVNTYWMVLCYTIEDDYNNNEAAWREADGDDRVSIRELVQQLMEGAQKVRESTQKHIALNIMILHPKPPTRPCHC